MRNITTFFVRKIGPAHVTVNDSAVTTYITGEVSITSERWTYTFDVRFNTPDEVRERIAGAVAFITQNEELAEEFRKEFREWAGTLQWPTNILRFPARAPL